MADFRLTRNGVPLVERPLDVPADQATVPDVGELQPYGFEVLEAEDDTAYAVALGDDIVDDPEGPGRVGRRRRRTVIWDDHPWFESARGFVTLRLLSRPTEVDGPWSERLRVALYARPTKISEAQYLGMASALMGLSAGLLFDVVGKASGRAGLGRDSKVAAVRPPHLELQAIEGVWLAIRHALDAICRQPVQNMTRRTELGRCWGGERLHPGALALLASRGLDPRQPVTTRPFTALRERLQESADTTEHRSIAGFLETLVGRLEECEQAIVSHVQIIEAERPFRSRGSATEESLYDEMDVPRLRKLAAAKVRAAELRRRISGVRRGAVLGPLTGVAAMPETPVFAHVVPYRRIRASARRYLRSSHAVLELGPEARAKSTSRMYEQWIFLQVASAFARAGLIGIALEQIVTQIEGARRFVVDLPRDARVVLRAADGRHLRIRYEPHVFGRGMAMGRGDSVYRGTGGDSPWSPDVLIEVLSPPGASAQSVQAAIVIDAKYSRRLRDEQWRDTAKYFQIRSTASSRAIVKQVWLAHPSATQTIQLRDSSVTWTENGPDVPWDEPLDGAISVLPPECNSDEDEDFLSGGAHVAPVMLQFALGVARAMGLTPISTTAPDTLST